MATELNLRAVGTYGEDLALKAYQKAGCRLVERNWRYHRMGEIDLILFGPGSQASLLIFSEVKLRKDPSFAEASLAVNRVKRNRIRKLARCFLQMHPAYAGYHVRFDVCEVVPDSKGDYEVHLIADAF